MRSIPDVSAPADPAQGVLICQADGGGCPTDNLYGGTSIAAPIWAASMAVLNQRTGSDFGFLNPQIYPLANGSAFHSGASMGSDFAHVGLGSPNFGELRRQLTRGTLGAPSIANSAVVAFPPLTYADGTSQVGVSVIVMDADFNAISGQSVTLTANSGSHAMITAVNGTSNVANGAARFIVTDNISETDHAHREIRQQRAGEHRANRFCRRTRRGRRHRRVAHDANRRRRQHQYDHGIAQGCAEPSRRE